MDLYEYEGKRLFAESGVPVPRSWMIHPHGPDPAEVASSFGLPLAVKAQVLSGGRGKAGGVRIARTVGELTTAAADIMTMSIGGRPVAGVLLEEVVDIDAEYYFAITVDRGARRPLVLFSTEGGVDIETVAREKPEAMHRFHVDPLEGLADEQVRDLAAFAGVAPEALDAGAGESGRAADALAGFATLVRGAWSCFCTYDATLVEINPLVRTVGGQFLALDSKVTVDDNALFRHPDLGGLEARGDPRDQAARAAGVTFVALDGDIGVLGNGAGLVMSTLDLIAAAGGAAADFLDVGGGAREAQIAAALDLVLADPGVKAVLVTIFGGITRGDEVARGLVTALQKSGATLPVVVRLDGNHAAEGRVVVARAGLVNVTVAETALDAVELVAARAAGAGGRGATVGTGA